MGGGGGLAFLAATMPGGRISRFDRAGTPRCALARGDVPAVHSAAMERDELLSAYAELRVADVRDGMDAVGLHKVGSMAPSIRPLYRTRACGIARTCRYLPYAGPVPDARGDDYRPWAGWYYGNVCTYPWIADIRDGDFVVIDASGVDAGLMGSANTLDAFGRGMRGLVTSGGVRDTDELILQAIPVWTSLISQSMVQARLAFDAKDCPVAVGGAAVRPGDLVVADGDGVIVVPRDAAEEVAHHAAAELRSDMKARGRLYRKTGRELDDTVTDPDA